MADPSAFTAADHPQARAKRLNALQARVTTLETRPIAYVPTNTQQLLADSTWTDIKPNGNAAAAGMMAKSDVASLYDSTTGIFTLKAGTWRISGILAFAANATGVRDAQIVVDSGSGYVAAFPTRRVNSQGAADATDIQFNELLVVGSAGAKAKLQGRQSSGGGALNTHINTRIQVEQVS